MNDIKAWYASKAVWGALIAIFASALQFLGVELGTAEQNIAADACVTIAGAVGGLVALYGRLAATAAIGRR